jgi:hypothetical protein
MVTSDTRHARDCDARRAPRDRAPARRGLLLLVPLLCAGIATAEARDEKPAEQVRRLLAEELESWPEVVTLQDALVAVGSGAIPELFEVLASDVVSDRDGEPRALGPRRELAVEGALERLPRRDLLDFLGALSRSRPTAPRRVTALELAGHLGSAKEVMLAIRLATGSESTARFRVRNALKAALHQILARDESAARTLTKSFSRVPPELRDVVVYSFASLESGRGATALTDLLCAVPELDAVILTEIRHLARLGARPDGYGLAAIRDCLRDNDPSASTMAVLAVVELDDQGAVPDLIYLLENSDERVEVAVNGALRQLTGRRLSPEPARWWSWYDAEREWLTSGFFEEERALSEGEHVEAAGAIRELASHTLFPEHVASPLVDVLNRADTELVVLACAGLGHLRAQSAIGPLIRCLEHEDPRVVAAAHAALTRTTGLELRPDPALWRSRTAPEEKQ